MEVMILIVLLIIIIFFLGIILFLGEMEKENREYRKQYLKDMLLIMDSFNLYNQNIIEVNKKLLEILGLTKDGRLDCRENGEELVGEVITLNLYYEKLSKMVNSIRKYQMVKFGPNRKANKNSKAEKLDLEKRMVEFAKRQIDPTKH